ncbi:polyhydroxyalkanoate depolymerase [Amaricoccus macauensis]|uniref:polyhydroxyalkanoate depolymerase n=1 Tax=Amaricoccus macauensis TaxID=57001 RepID=UPI003C7CB1AD
MIYQAYQLQDDLVAPFRTLASAFKNGAMPDWWKTLPTHGHISASLEMLSRFKLTHQRPPFGIEEVMVGNRIVPVKEVVELEKPFGNLLHFEKDIDTPQPKILVVAPLSGHFATLLRGTVETLLQDHDVYITDWMNARDVPVSAGNFGIEDHVDYIIEFLEHLGPRSNILAVCQPCVQALIAVAIMSKRESPATPVTMTLMAGPIDTRESPTTVNDLANEKPLEWFKNNVIATVPARYKGAGRKVYPGFLQLTAFMMMNMDRHREAHRKLYLNLANGDMEKAQKTIDFYDEYFAVLDLSAEFYIETIERIFQRAELAEGTFHYRGELVDCGAIRKTALLTVEGGRDDICSLGQTTAAHDLCSSLRPHLKRHHLQANVGHYGVFNGKRWEKEIYPMVRNLILAME